MGRHIWGYWDCDFCGNKKLRGDIEECPSCGHPRSTNVKFYMDKGNIEYVSEEKKSSKANWICPYCDTQNEDSETVCEYCGASRTESKETYHEVQERLEKTAEKVQETIEEPDEEEETAPYDDYIYINGDNNRVSVDIKHSSANVKKWLLFGAVGIAIAFIIGLLVWFFTPVKHNSQVSGFEWDRNITIQSLETFDEEGWSLPSGARLHYTNEEIRSYNTVIDHYEPKTRQVEKERYVGEEEYVSGYEDLGNGQFEEIISKRPVYETYYDTETYEEPVYTQVPEYDTKYYYEIDKWVYSRSVKTSGTNHEPYWGETTLGDKEREGSKDGNYWLICGEYRTILSLGEWQGYEIGDKVIVTTNRSGDIVYSIEKG